jgi:multidrug efflux pump subunit AcrB
LGREDQRHVPKRKAFLGIASLIGVIVSHVIVLFDFVEVMRERGEPIEEALRNAGIQRLRPAGVRARYRF